MMVNKLIWNIAEIYPSFESGEFQGDYNKVIEMLAEFKRLTENLCQENAAQSIKDYILFLTEYGQKASQLCDFCELTLATDAENKTALNYIEKIEDALSETSAPETRFSLFLRDLSEETLTEALGAEPVVKEHEFYLREIRRKAKHILSEAEENIISKMETTGSSAWIKFQDNVMSTLTGSVLVDGEMKKLPFTEIRNLAYDKSAEVRKNGYDAELQACKTAARACAAALNGIKGEVITVSKLRGYASPLEMTVSDARLDMDTLDALIASMGKNISVFKPYFKKKAELLGIKDKGLPFYDLFAPIGAADLNFSFEQAVDFVCENFRDFSPELGDYARRAADSGWIDVYPKEGKRGGAFCQNLHYLKQSRFLLNFKGSFSDVLTLAHELGHGYHGECLNSEAFLNSDYPMPIAETASTLCETIVVNAALKNASRDERLAILENGVSGAAQVIVDIYSRFLFESRLFETRREGSLSVQELCGLMRNAQLEAYGDALDGEWLHEYMWVVKPHYYSASYNFYNFPYAFGQLFSNGLYSLFLNDGSGFPEVYRKTLSQTGKLSLKDAAKTAGIDISLPDFWDSAFDVIKSDINMFIEA